MQIISTETTSIVVNLAPPEVKMNPGDPARPVIATVQNAGTTVDQYTIEVENLDASWYTVTAAKVALFPGDSAPVTIMLHPPKAQTVIAGRYTFEVRAVSDNRTRYGTTKGVIEIAGIVQVQGQLMPKRVTGRRGNYKLTLANTGTQETHLELSGTDAETNLNYSFKDPEPTLAPYASVEIPVKVKPRNFHFVGQPKHYAFTITYPDFGSDPTAAPADPRNMRQVQGELIHKPILRSWRWPIIMGLLGLIAFIVLIVRPDPCGPLLSWSFLCQKAAPIPPPQVQSFTITPPDPRAGEDVKLIYRTSNAQAAFIEELGETVPLTVTNGQGRGETTKKIARSSTFTLCAQNEDGVVNCFATQRVQIGQEPVPTPTTGVRPTKIATVPTKKGSPTAGSGQNGGNGENGGNGGGDKNGGGGKGTPTRAGGRGGTPTRTPTRRAGTPTRTPTRGAGATATPTRLAPTAAVVACVDQAQNTNGGTANPATIKVGERITLKAGGFTPNKAVQIILTDPEGNPQVPAFAEQPRADANGNFEPLFTVGPPIITNPVPGTWRAKLQDATTGRTVEIFFCVTQ